MIKVNFFLQGTKQEQRIYFRYAPSRQLDIKCKTPFSINKDYWDKDNQCYNLNLHIRGAKTAEAKNRNREIIDFNNRLTEFHLDISNKIQNNLNEPNLKEIITDYINETYFHKKIERRNKQERIPTNLYDLMDFYIKFKSKRDVTQGANSISSNTIKSYKAFQKLILRYDKNTDVREINDMFRRDFADYMQEIEGYTPQTQGKYMKYIKMLCVFADREHTISREVYKWKITNDFDDDNGTEITFTAGQLAQLQQLELSNNSRLDNVRDWLLISCYTAVRISELMEMKKENITTTPDGEQAIKIIEQKNINKKGKGLKFLPLFPTIKDILNKRGGDFPKPIAHQNYNKYIKELCQLAGFTQIVEGKKTQTTQIGNRKKDGKYQFWELVTSHIGRKTFTTLNIDILGTDIVQMVTNHKNEKTLNHYNKTPYEVQQLKKVDKVIKAFKDINT